MISALGEVEADGGARSKHCTRTELDSLDSSETRCCHIDHYAKRVRL